MSRPIVQRPDVLFGAPHVEGAGAPVGLIVFDAAMGRSAAWLCDEFEITRDELHAALTWSRDWRPSPHVSALLADEDRADPGRLLRLLWSDPDILGGKACFLGTRLPIRDFVARAESFGAEAGARGLPVWDRTLDDLKAAVFYAERVAFPRYRSRISVDPRVMAGKPVIRETRITVEHLLLEVFFDDDPVAVVTDGYPDIALADLRAAVAWALFGGDGVPRIEADPWMPLVPPWFKGTERTIYDVLDALQGGAGLDGVQERWPDLPPDSAMAALAWAVRPRVPWPDRGSPQVVRDPNVMAGVPTLRGTDVTVGLVRGRLLAGWSVADICLWYDLTPDEVGCAVAFEPYRPDLPT